jgi:hypothetical protein
VPQTIEEKGRALFNVKTKEIANETMLLFKNALDQLVVEKKGKGEKDGKSSERMLFSARTLL